MKQDDRRPSKRTGPDKVAMQNRHHQKDTKDNRKGRENLDVNPSTEDSIALVRFQKVGHETKIYLSGAIS